MAIRQIYFVFKDCKNLDELPVDVYNLPEIRDQEDHPLEG